MNLIGPKVLVITVAEKGHPTFISINIVISNSSYVHFYFSVSVFIDFKIIFIIFFVFLCSPLLSLSELTLYKAIEENITTSEAKEALY